MCLRTVPLPPPVALTHCFISHSQPFNFMSHITRYCLDVVMQRHCLPAGRPRMCTAQPASQPPFLCQCGVKPLALASWPPRNCQLPESNRVAGFVSRRQSPPTERCVHSTHTHTRRSGSRHQLYWERSENFGFVIDRGSLMIRVRFCSGSE